MKETGFFAEFKKFITRGNVLDMAVGVIIGGAFTAIVNSLVNNILNPVIGLITGGMDLSNLKVVLKAAVGDTPEVAILYGSFINAIINFLLVALVLFLIIKSFNKLNEKKKKEEEAAAAAVPPAPPVKSDEVVLLEEIRDLLKKN